MLFNNYLTLVVVPLMASVGAQNYDADSLSLSITDIFERIESDNRTMIVLRSEQEAAEEGIKAAKNAIYPEISAEVNVSYIGDAFTTDRDFSNFTVAQSPHFGNGFTLDVQQVIYAGGAVKAGVRLAQNQSTMTLAQTEKSRQDLRLLSVGQYLDLYRIANNIKVYEENISLTRKLIEEIRVRREQGLALANDVTRYELRLEMLRLELVRLRNTEKILNYRLCNTLCLPSSTVIKPVLDEVEDIRSVSFVSWQSIATQFSPELKMSDLNAEMASDQLALVRSEMLPKVALVAHESFNGPITFEVPPIDKNLNIWYVGVGVKYNLSSLYKSSRKVRQSEVQMRLARERETVAEENLKNDVYQAYMDYEQAYVELDTRRKSLQLADENYGRVYDRYVEQLALITDMLDAFNMKLDAELGVSEAKAEILYRQCKLKYAAGVL